MEHRHRPYAVQTYADYTRRSGATAAAAAGGGPRRPHRQLFRKSVRRRRKRRRGRRSRGGCGAALPPRRSGKRVRNADGKTRGGRTVGGACAVRHQPYAESARRQARPGHRPRQGNRTHYTDTLPQDKEQSRADRRTRRGQIRDCGRTCAGYRERTGARPSDGQDCVFAGHYVDGCRHALSRRLRGAAEKGNRRHQARGQHHSVYRRDTYDTRHGVYGRGRHRRRQRPETDACPRRIADHRRHDCGRIPQVFRKGRGFGAQVPAHNGGTAHGVRYD